MPNSIVAGGVRVDEPRPRLQQTIFTRHAASMQSSIEEFDEEFYSLLAERKWKPKKSRSKEILIAGEDSLAPNISFLAGQISRLHPLPQINRFELDSPLAQLFVDTRKDHLPPIIPLRLRVGRIKRSAAPATEYFSETTPAGTSSLCSSVRPVMEGPVKSRSRKW